jgi:CRP-like cAMP-binding protein/ABC-type transporter Mla MlaB component
VFFNSAENAVLHIESFIKKADYFILDMKRVSAVDITGATLILQFGARLEKEKKYLLISYLKENLSLWEFFEIMDMKKLSDNTVFFQDTDGAAEWAEEHLLSVLSRSAAVCAQIRPEDMDIVKNFTQRELADFQEKLRCRTYRKGEAVFREGDPGKDLFLLTKGSVTVKVRLPESDRFRRLFTFTPGVVFGEVALLDGKPRSADVWAEEETEVFRLSLEDFDVLRKEKPEIVIKLLLNIAKEFSRNLRRISDEVRAMENG